MRAAFRPGPADGRAHGTATPRAIVSADHRALDQRRVGDAHPAAARLADQLVDGELRRQHRRAELHQHQHAVAVVGGLDGLGDQGGVGADAAVVGAAGGPDAHLGGHLSGQLHHTLSDLGRVGHDHQAHAHGPAPPVLDARPPAWRWRSIMPNTVGSLRTRADCLVKHH